MSPPWRWYDDSAPSPVLCRQPANWAPLLSAEIALPPNEPKLIPDTLITDAGRNFFARSRGPPSTLADGSRSEEHTSELQSLMRISYAVFCLKNKQSYNTTT